MQYMYNTDPKFKALADKVVGSAMDLGNELGSENGWTFEDNQGSLEKAANQWNTVGLWSVGMTATKTQAINSKMMKVAQDAMVFGSDPVYGPYIQGLQQHLGDDVETAFNKYEKKMEHKYNTDPKFKAMADRLNGSAMDLGNELGNGNGLTFEDNDGSLEKAANQWNTMQLWSAGMTDSKTQAVNKKMMKVVQDAMKFGSDPVYGPFIEKQQEILGKDLE
jgi:hypothetical protein